MFRECSTLAGNSMRDTTPQRGLFMIDRNRLMAGLIGLCCIAPGLHAQVAAPAVPVSRMIQIREVEARGEPTPEYSYRVRGSTKNDGKRDWLVARCEFDTAPAWIDEMTFSYYVVLQADASNLAPGADTVNLFAGKVTYMNVMRGRHESTMFLDPNTFARYGEYTHVAVVVDINGERAAVKANPDSNVEWWTRKQPTATPLLRRDETPWRFIEVESHNTIKP